MSGMEVAILTSARIVLKNPRLNWSDIRSWSQIQPEVAPGEVAAHLLSLGVFVVVRTERDKRGGQG